MTELEEAIGKDTDLYRGIVLEDGRVYAQIPEHRYKTLLEAARKLAANITQDIKQED